MSSVRISRDEKLSDLPPQVECELERRKKDWQREVDKLQEQFFKMPLPKSNGETNYVPAYTASNKFIYFVNVYGINHINIS